jgi:hypothetical protein
LLIIVISLRLTRDNYRRAYYAIRQRLIQTQGLRPVKRRARGLKSFTWAFGELRVYGGYQRRVVI